MTGGLALLPPAVWTFLLGFVLVLVGRRWSRPHLAVTARFDAEAGLWRIWLQNQDPMVHAVTVGVRSAHPMRRVVVFGGVGRWRPRPTATWARAVDVAAPDGLRAHATWLVEVTAPVREIELLVLNERLKLGTAPLDAQIGAPMSQRSVVLLFAGLVVAWLGLSYFWFGASRDTAALATLAVLAVLGWAGLALKFVQQPPPRLSQGFQGWHVGGEIWEADAARRDGDGGQQV